MGSVQYFVGVLLLSAALVLTSPTRTKRSSKECLLCPAGKYQKTCTKCEPCPHGSYTAEDNREVSCHICFRDCLPEYHLRVVQNCTSTSNVRCICEPGFKCTEKVSFSDNCRACEKVPTEVVPRLTKEDRQTPSPTSLGHTQPLLSPKSDLQTVSTVRTDTHTEKASTRLATILSLTVFLGCVALVILVYVSRPRDETCFRQTIKKLCNQEGQDTPQRFKEPSHQFPRHSFSAKQQLSSPSAANLGPVHVHNPGTVIFSLLSHFTSPAGPNVPETRATEAADPEEDERDCPVFHPTSSPSIHFSEEERSGEIENIFFPSQEQGKDCHVSKEEGL